MYSKINIPGKLLVAELKIKINAIYGLSKKDQTAALVVKKSRVLTNNNMLVSELYKMYAEEEDGWLYLVMEPSKPF